jgi:hypothetical protein
LLGGLSEFFGLKNSSNFFAFLREHSFVDLLTLLSL